MMAKMVGFYFDLNVSTTEAATTTITTTITTHTSTTTVITNNRIVVVVLAVIVVVIVMVEIVDVTAAVVEALRSKVVLTVKEVLVYSGSCSSISSTS